LQQKKTLSLRDRQIEALAFEKIQKAVKTAALQNRMLE
jgi:hypothetical protein